MAGENLLARIIIDAQDRASGVFNTLKSNAFSVVTAITGFFSVGLFAGAVSDAQKLEEQMGIINSVIKATGGAAGVTAEEIAAMAKRIGDPTEVRAAAAELLTFKSVGRDTFETTLSLAKDLAEAGFGSIESNAVQLGKALEDPVNGLTALTRSGVTFTESQKNMIASLVESGDKLKAQGIIIDAVAKQVGGAGSGADVGLAGALDNISERFQYVRETIGTAFLPALTQAANTVADFTGKLLDSGAIDAFANRLVGAFRSGSEWALNFLKTANFDEITASAAKFFERINFGFSLVSGTVSVFATGILTIKAAFDAVSAAGALFISGLFAGAAKVDQVFASLSFGEASKKYEREAETLNNISEAFAASAKKNFTDASNSMNQVVDSSKGVKNAFNDIIGSTSDVGQEAQKTSVALESTAKSGENAAQGINKVSDSAAELSNKVFNLERDLSKLNNEQLAKFGNEAQDAFKKGEISADQLKQKLGELSDQALKNIGVKFEEIKKSAQDFATESVQAFEAARQSGQYNTDQLQELANAIAKTANNADDLKALEQAFAGIGVKIDETAVKADKLSGHFTDLYTSASAAFSEIHQSGNASSETLEKLAGDINANRNNAEGMKQVFADLGFEFDSATGKLTKLDGGARTAKGSTDNLSDSVDHLAKSTNSASDALNNIGNEAAQFTSELKASTDALNAEQDKITQAVSESSDSIASHNAQVEQNIRALQIQQASLDSNSAEYKELTLKIAAAGSAMAEVPKNLVVDAAQLSEVTANLIAVAKRREEQAAIAQQIRELEAARAAKKKADNDAIIAENNKKMADLQALREANAAKAQADREEKAKAHADAVAASNEKYRQINEAAMAATVQKAEAETNLTRSINTRAEVENSVSASIAAREQEAVATQARINAAREKALQDDQARKAEQSALLNAPKTFTAASNSDVGLSFGKPASNNILYNYQFNPTQNPLSNNQQIAQNPLASKTVVVQFKDPRGGNINSQFTTEQDASNFLDMLKRAQGLSL